MEAYAQDEKLFFENYARAHVKISERGHEEYLMSEFDESDMVDGGYVEHKGAHWSTTLDKDEEEAEGKEVQIWWMNCVQKSKKLILNIWLLFKPI